MIRSIAGSIVRPLAVAITGASGGAAPAPDTYAANGFSPDFVADESLATPYYRVSGSTSDYDTVYTSDTGAGGLSTMVDSSGNLVWGPHNLFQYSEDQGSGPWRQFNATLSANSTVAPDGETTADTVTEDTSANVHGWDHFSPAVSVIQGVSYTIAYVVKANGRTRFNIRDWGAGSPFIQEFNLSTESTSTTSGTVDSASITSLGDGFYLCVVTAPATNTSLNGQLRFLDGAGNESYTGDGSSGIIVWGAHCYRSDLGGMADVPADQRAVASLTKYVPTTTTARYLLRRGHYRYNGTSYVPTLLHEPVGATNSCDQSRLFDGAGGWVVNNGMLNTQNAVGIDGVANSATTIEDNNASGYEFLSLASTVTSDTARRGFSCYFKKTTSATTYPALGLEYGGATVRGVTIDTNNGTLTDRASLAPDASYIEDAGDFWRVSVFQDNNSNTAFTIYVYPAVNSDGSGTWTPTAGSAVIDQVDLYLDAGTSVPSSPIPTTGSTVARAADTCKVNAAALPYSSTAMSMAIAARIDSAAGSEIQPLSWEQDVNNRLLIYTNGQQIRAFMESGGVTEVAADGSISNGLSEGVSAAARFVASGEVQSALNGTAGSPETATTPAMPPLSDDDLSILSGTLYSSNGELDTIRLWSDDITEPGIEDATT